MSTLQEKALQEALKLLNDLNVYDVVKAAQEKLKHKIAAIAPSLSEKQVSELVNAVGGSSQEHVDFTGKKIAIEDWIKAVLNKAK